MPSTEAEQVPRSVIAAGVLRDVHGRVLIAQRPAGVHLAGLWEFPGGKVEKDETIVDALHRELFEEIGIRVVKCRTLIEVEHCYPERIVRLHVFLVSQWLGRPEGREAQALRWCLPGELESEVFPQADLPVIALLKQRDNRGAYSGSPTSSGGTGSPGTA